MKDNNTGDEEEKAHVKKQLEDKKEKEKGMTHKELMKVR